MRKIRLFKFFIVHLIVAFCFVNIATAEDVIIELSTSDGTTGLVIKDASGNEVAKIDSKGVFFEGLQKLSVPPGTVVSFAGNTPPEGWLSCDGQSLNRSDYPELFNVIKTMYGLGNNIPADTTFNLPDYRGYFLRGRDNGAGIDPGASSRIDRGDGTAGDNVGTKQDDMYKSHAHQFSTSSEDGGTAWVTDRGTYHYTYGNTTNSGGNETRPKNISVMYCIKY